MLIYQPSLKGYLIFKQSLTIDVGGEGLPPICKLKNFLNNLVHVFNLTISSTPYKHIEAGGSVKCDEILQNVPLTY